MREVGVDPTVFIVLLVEILEFHVVELTRHVEHLAGATRVTEVDVSTTFVSCRHLFFLKTLVFRIETIHKLVESIGKLS